MNGGGLAAGTNGVVVNAGVTGARRSTIHGFAASATATQNAQGVSAVNGGSILSFGNNRIAGNTIDGSVSATVPLQ